MEYYKYKNHKGFCKEIISSIEEEYFYEDIFSPHIQKILKIKNNNKIKVTILDSGLVEHKCLVNTKYFVNMSNSKSGKDVLGHANMSAGILSASCKINGLCPNIELLSVKVTDDVGHAKLENVCAGILWAIIMKSKLIVVNHVINSSTNILNDTFTKAIENDAIVVCESHLNLENVVNSASLQIKEKETFTCFNDNNYAKFLSNDFKNSFAAAVCVKYLEENDKIVCAELNRILKDK